MPKSNKLPTDPRFPAFREHVEGEWGARLPDDNFYADERLERGHEPYHAEPARAFRMFVAGWDAALSAAPTPTQEGKEGGTSQSQPCAEAGTHIPPSPQAQHADGGEG